MNATVRVSVLALRLLAGVGDPSSGLAHRGPGLLHPQPWMFEAESSGLSEFRIRLPLPPKCWGSRPTLWAALQAILKCALSVSLWAHRAFLKASLGLDLYPFSFVRKFHFSESARPARVWFVASANTLQLDGARVLHAPLPHTLP